MTYANAQRPTQRLYACGTNPTFVIHQSTQELLESSLVTQCNTTSGKRCSPSLPPLKRLTTFMDRFQSSLYKAHDRYSMIHTGIHCRSHPTRAHDVHNNAITHHNLFEQCNKHNLSKHCNKCGLSQHCVQSAFHDACHTKTHAKPMHIQHQP